MRNFTLARPTDSAAAFAGFGSDAAYIAGGTDLMQLMKDDVAAPSRVVDIEVGAVGDAVTATPAGLRIGAAAKMSDVAAHPAVASDYPVVAQALLASASPQVRNMASIGGNLLQRTRCGYFRDTGFPCNKRVPGSGCPAIAGENRMHAILGGSAQCVATNASDLAVALVAMGAMLDLDGPQGRRQVPLVEFHLLPGDTPQRETVLRPGELIVAVVLPATAWLRRSAYLKVRDRATFEWAVVSAAVALDVEAGRIRDARVALGGVGTKPWRSPAAEAALRGQPAEQASFAAAAQVAVQGAKPLRENGFKVVLAQRAMVRALATLV